MRLHRMLSYTALYRKAASIRILIWWRAARARKKLDHKCVWVKEFSIVGTTSVSSAYCSGYKRSILKSLFELCATIKLVFKHSRQTINRVGHVVKIWKHVWRSAASNERWRRLWARRTRSYFRWRIPISSWAACVYLRQKYSLEHFWRHEAKKGQRTRMSPLKPPTRPSPLNFWTPGKERANPNIAIIAQRIKTWTT